MKINKGDLLNLIEPVVRIADKKGSMPVLEGLLLWTEEGKLKARATDLINDITRAFSGNLEYEDYFRVLVPANEFFSVVKVFPEGEISLNRIENWLIIEAGGVVCKLTTLSPEGFPLPPEIENGQFSLFFLPRILADTLEATFYAIAQEETIHALSGLCFDFLDGAPGYVVATNNHRLARCKLRPSDISGKQPTGQYIVPEKTIRELISASKKVYNDMLQLAFSDSRFTAFWEENKFQTKISASYIRDSFPNWRNVFNPSFAGNITVNRKALIEALKRITVLANGRFKPVALMVEKEYLIIKSRDDELNVAQEQIPAKFEGEIPNVTLNAVYLIDALEPVQSPEVVLEIGSKQAPIRIQDGAYMALVMPMSMKNKHEEV